jgi:hypothetical protein
MNIHTLGLRDQGAVHDVDIPRLRLAHQDAASNRAQIFGRALRAPNRAVRGPPPPFGVVRIRPPGLSRHVESVCQKSQTLPYSDKRGLSRRPKAGSHPPVTLASHSGRKACVVAIVALSDKIGEPWTTSVFDGSGVVRPGREAVRPAVALTPSLKNSQSSGRKHWKQRRESSVCLTKRAAR